MALSSVSTPCTPALAPALLCGHRLPAPCDEHRLHHDHGGASAWLFLPGALSIASLCELRPTSERRTRTRRKRVSARKTVAAAASILEAWRALPEEEPANIEKLLRSIRNDLVHEELDPTPLRSVALLMLPVQSTAVVGQIWQAQLPTDTVQHKAVLEALEKHGGFVGLAVDTENAQTLPRGCVGAEINNVAEAVGGKALVTMRCVTSLRIIDRASDYSEKGYPVTLVQECREWTKLEELAGGETPLCEELTRLFFLFDACGELQNKTGLWAAGDLYSHKLDALTEGVSDTLNDVVFCGLEDGGSSLLAAAQRRAVLASHAAVMALRDAKRANFLTDPVSVLRRLRRLNKFLAYMEEVLRGRL